MVLLFFFGIDDIENEVAFWLSVVIKKKIGKAGSLLRQRVAGG